MTKIKIAALVFILSEVAFGQGRSDWARTRRRAPQEPPANEKSVRVRDAKLGQAILQGDGCAEGTVSTTLSPDQKTLSILFDDFQVEAGPGQERAARNCRIRLPLLVPSGFQVAIVKTDLRGFVDLTEGAQSTVRVVHHLTGKKGPPRQRNPHVENSEEEMIDRRPFAQNLDFVGPVSEEFILGTHMEEETTWSPCGQKVTLQIGAQAQVQARKPGATGLTMIDSLDFQGDSKKAVDYHLFWRACR